MKRSFRDDDRHASISRAKLGAIFQGSLSLRGRTFLTITCATGMAIDQPCKSNNNVPSNVLSVVTFFHFLFSARISLNRRSPLLQLLKKNTSTISSLLDTISLYLREISWKFSFFVYIEFYRISRRSKDVSYLKTCVLFTIIIFSIRCLKKRHSKDLCDLHSIVVFYRNIKIILT